MQEPPPTAVFCGIHPTEFPVQLEGISKLGGAESGLSIMSWSTTFASGWSPGPNHLPSQLWLYFLTFLCPTAPLSGYANLPSEALLNTREKLLPCSTGLHHVMSEDSLALVNAVRCFSEGPKQGQR